MLAVRRSACFYTTVGLCETSTLFFFRLLMLLVMLLLLPILATDRSAPDLHADTLLYLPGFIDY